MGYGYGAQVDPALDAVLQAGKRFQRVMPFVDISGLPPDRILAMLDPKAVDDLRNGQVDEDEFRDGILAFLVRTAMLKTSQRERHPDDMRTLLVGASQALSLSDDDLEKAKDRLWCTIWPICPTGK